MESRTGSDAGERLRAAQERLRRPRAAVPASAPPALTRSTATKAAAAAGGELEFLPWLRCPHRGTVVGTCPGGVAGCGCASQTVEAFACEKFGVPVLKVADPRRTEQIARHVPGFTGRQCRTCEMFGAVARSPDRATGPTEGLQVGSGETFGRDLGGVWRPAPNSGRPAPSAPSELNSGESDMEVKISAGGRQVARRVVQERQLHGSTWRNANVRKPLPESGLISPADHKIVQLEVTNRCFLNCSNCTRLVGHQAQPYEMDRATFAKAVESVADHPGMVGIMGGEPTLHQDFAWLVRHYAAVIDPGVRYERLRQPVADLAAYRTKYCASLDHRRGIWSAIGPRFLEHLELISDVFGYWCLNDHRHQGQHQALLMARQDLGIPADEWRALRDQCWVQRTWSSSVNPAGAYFCEVAAAIDWTLFGGCHAWPIEPGWWRRTPADFAGQLALCEYCAAPLNVPARLPEENRDDVTPTLVPLLAAVGSPRVERGRIVVHDSASSGQSSFGVEGYMRQADGAIDNDARVARDNSYLRLREIVGVVVCVDCHDRLPKVLQRAVALCDRVAVVTTSDDRETQRIAAAAGAQVVVSDNCYAGGDSFNKGRMLNAGLAALDPRDWVLFFDADVLLAPDWGDWLRGRVLNPGVLYHARRVHAVDDGQWAAAVADWAGVRRLKVRDPAADMLPFGFHQLWNVRAAAIAGRSPLVSEVFPTAATVDYHWYRLWPADKRVRLPDELSVVHRWHGPFASRWHNRGVTDRGWEWVGQVSPVGPLWFLQDREPQWPAQVKLIDLDTEQAELVSVRSRRRLEKYIGSRVVDVYVRASLNRDPTGSV